MLVNLDMKAQLEMVLEIFDRAKLEVYEGVMYDKVHTTVVAEIVDVIGRELGWSVEKQRLGWQVALLHDLGRVGIDYDINIKVGAAMKVCRSEDEWRKHIKEYNRYLAEGKSRQEAFDLVYEWLKPEIREGAKKLGLDIDIDDLVQEYAIKEFLRIDVDHYRRAIDIYEEHEKELKAVGLEMEPERKADIEAIILNHDNLSKLPVDFDISMREVAEALVFADTFARSNDSETGRAFLQREFQSERLYEAFSCLRKRMRNRNISSQKVYKAFAKATAEGRMDKAIKMARRMPLDAPLPLEDESFKGLLVVVDFSILLR